MTITTFLHLDPLHLSKDIQFLRLLRISEHASGRIDLTYDKFFIWPEKADSWIQNQVENPDEVAKICHFLHSLQHATLLAQGMSDPLWCNSNEELHISSYPKESTCHFTLLPLNSRQPRGQDMC